MNLSITLLIIIITTLVSMVAMSNRKVLDNLIFYPPAVTTQNQWYRFFSCGLIHADFGHLFFNMLSLYFFGDNVEAYFTSLFGPNGKWLYLVLYISALLVSLLPTYLKNKNNPNYRSLGASGAVSAVIFAGLLFAPASQIYVYFFPMPSFVFAPLYLVFTALMDRRGGDNINHSAHLWGSLYGLAFVIIACRFIDFPIVQNAINQIRAFF